MYESQESCIKPLEPLHRVPRLRETLGRRARRGYEQYYTDERYVGAYLDLIGAIRQRKSVVSST